MIPMNQTPLSQLAVISAGQGAPKDNEFSESGTPFVRAGSLEALLSGKNESELELVSADTAKLRKLKTYPKGTILFAKSGMSATKDRVYVVQSPAHVVSHLATLIPKDGAHGDYLRHALKRFPPSSLIKDPAYPAIGLGDIEKFEIPVPQHFDDQIRIAHLLGKVEGLIAQRKQHLQQLDDLLKSVFLDMFGDLKISEGESTLEDCLKIQQGFAFKSDEFTDSGVPVIKIGTVNKGFFDYSTLSFIAGDYPQKIRRFEIKPGDLLISLTGTVGKDDYGNTCFVPSNAAHSTYLLNQRVGKLECDRNIAHPIFIDAFLKLPKVKSELIKQNRGVRQANLSNSDIYGIQLSIPPIDQQQQFAVIVEKIEGIKSRYQQSLTELEALYGALSQKVFKGDLDLSRVCLPIILAEKENIEALETLHTPAEQNLDHLNPSERELVIHLPDTASLLDAIENVEARKSLLTHWLEAYYEQMVDRTFSVQRFMFLAEIRIAELHPDSNFVLGTSEYDHIKSWVFKALDDGRLMQIPDVTGHDRDGTPVLGNQVELKALRR